MQTAEGAGFEALYQRAFDEFGALALWNLKRLERPTPGHALVVARALRIEGDLAARRLAEEIEAGCLRGQGIGATDGRRMGTDLIAAMQALPYRELDIEPAKVRLTNLREVEL